MERGTIEHRLKDLEKIEINITTFISKMVRRRQCVHSKNMMIYVIYATRHWKHLRVVMRNE